MFLVVVAADAEICVELGSMMENQVHPYILMFYASKPKGKMRERQGLLIDLGWKKIKSCNQCYIYWEPELVPFYCPWTIWDKLLLLKVKIPFMLKKAM